MKRRPMIELRLLGSTELNADGEDAGGAIAGPKRLGLLAYLVLARPRGHHRRDHILGLLWPERGQRAARNALSNLLYHLRVGLGEETIANRGTDDVGIRPGALWCDALAFEDAVADEHFDRAAELYRGDLLEGFHLPDASPVFDQWLVGERERLRAAAAGAFRRLAEERSLEDGHAAARRWASRATALTPFSEEACICLMEVLERAGDRPGALGAYRDFVARVREEWDLGPSHEIRTMARRIREGGTSGAEHPSGARPEGQGHAVAVLPFDTIGERRTPGFTEGMHGDVLTRLSNVSALKVISRTSVRRYAGSEKSIPEIAGELDAAWVLEGEVQEAANQVLVNVRLVDAHLDRQVWARDYRRHMTASDLFDIQEEITKEIVRALEAELSAEEERRMEDRPTLNLDAYRLYVQGRSHLDQRTAEGMRRALEYFERAVALDDTFALPWVGLADALHLLADYGYEEEIDPRADEAVGRALEIDPKSAEAHASLGAIHAIRRRGPDALRALARAVELRPTYAEAHNWLSWVGNLLGRREEALESARKAVELNPLSPEAVTNLSLSYLAVGRPREALMEARKERELGSGWGTGKFYEALALYRLGRYAEAIGVLEGLEVPWAGVGAQGTLALAHVAAQNHEVARDMLAMFEGKEEAFAVGVVRLSLGEIDPAFEAFDRVQRWGHWPTLSLRHLYDGLWDPVHDDPRFRSVFDRMQSAWGLATKALGRGDVFHASR